MVLPPGHHLNVTTRRSFSRFEKWTLGIVAGGLAVFLVVILIAVSGPGQSTARGCVDVTIVGATGAASIYQCGDNARAVCRAAGTPRGYVGEAGRQIAAACRRDGFAVG